MKSTLDASNLVGVYSKNVFGSIVITWACSRLTALESRIGSLCPKVFVSEVCTGVERNEIHIQREANFATYQRELLPPANSPNPKTRSRSRLLAVPLERRYT